jgi:hypothetical protein
VRNLLLSRTALPNPPHQQRTVIPNPFAPFASGVRDLLLSFLFSLLLLLFPGAAGNTMYIISPWPGIDKAFQQVQTYNALTFTYGQGSQAKPGGNITFTANFDPAPNPYYASPLPYAPPPPGFLGADFYSSAEPIPLTVNKFVLASNCKLVRTFYPTYP